MNRIRVSENKVFVDKSCIGEIEGGYFVQKITDRSIYRKLNAKGMDISVYRHLLSRCKGWMLIHKQTKQVWRIEPFSRIEEMADREYCGTAGNQLMVRLEHFNVLQPALQKRLVL